MPYKPPIHKPAGRVSQEEKKKAYDKVRPSSSKRGYGRAWQKIRLLILKEEPLCRFCKDKNLIVQAEHVDHINGNSKDNRRENLRPLCAKCHNSRTARDQAFGRKHIWGGGYKNLCNLNN